MRESDYGRNWYLSYLCSLVKSNKTIINRFHTCMFIVISGSTQVPLKGYDDKRQMMALLEIVRDGYILPPQLLYQRKTDEPSQI